MKVGTKKCRKCGKFFKRVRSHARYCTADEQPQEVRKLGRSPRMDKILAELEAERDRIEQTIETLRKWGNP